MGESHYDVLGVSPHAEDVVIEGAYKALLRRYHPDARPGAGASEAAVATARVVRINEAYRVLRDKDARARYDRDQASRRFEPPVWAAPDPDPAPDPEPPSVQAWTPVSASSAAPAPRPAVSIGRAVMTAVTYVALAGLVGAGGVGLFIGATDLLASPPAATSAAPEPVPAAVEPVSTPEGVQTKATAKAPAMAAARAKPGASRPDCATASGVPALICGEPALAQADREVTERYRRLLATTRAPAQARADQRRWLAERDAAPAQVEVLLRLHQNRLRALGSEQAIAEQIY